MASTTRSSTLVNFAGHGPVLSDILRQFVRFATQGVHAEGSFLILSVEGTLILAHPFGSIGASLPSCEDIVSICPPSGGNDDPFGVQSFTLFDDALLVMIAAERDGRFLGVLGVRMTSSETLNQAQRIVLHSVALEIAEQLEREYLRDALPDIADPMVNLIVRDPYERLRLLESVIVNANDPVLITEAEPIDAPGPRIHYVNPAFTRTTGYSPDDVLGKSPRILQGPLTGVEGPTRIRAALEAWKPVEVELLNYRKDGSTFWVELSISPVCNEKGWYTHWVSVQRDISDRKAKEESAARILATNLQNQALTEEIRHRKLIEAKLSHVAFHDSLRNRTHFMDRLSVALRRTQTRRDYRAAVIYLDLDGFKTINDTLGHRVGDSLLKEIARRLSECTRVQDTLARLGGDEFTVIIDDLSGIEQALEVAHRMLQAVKEPIVLAGMKLQVTSSIGLCEINHTYAEADDILRDADTAMYRSKRLGGSHVVIYEASMHESALAALQLKQQVKASVEDGQLELYYQTLEDTGTSSIYGVEALLRWHHPTRGLLTPSEFIDVAEGTGSIVAIGLWVLRQACIEFRTLESASQRKLLLSVNVSSRQLDEASFLGDLWGALEESGMPPDQLQLEITESIFIKDASRIGAMFHSIRARGVQIAFDDFGTGYSSLSYLERYPIDTLKIDQSFVQNMAHDSIGVDIIRMIIGLAHVIGMTVSAEGVEAHEQAAELARLGCTRVQGYLYSRPMTLISTRDMLEGRSGTLPEPKKSMNRC